MSSRFQRSCIRCAASGLYTGFLPLVPGTFGSLAGLGIYFLLSARTVPVLIACCVSLVIGWLTAGRAEALDGRKDPKWVVIDEVAGMLLSLVFVPFDPKLVILGFFFYRLLDTLKPFPASRLQDLHGSTGIMIDDVIVAVYTNLILRTIAVFI